MKEPYKNKELMHRKLIKENKSYRETSKELGCSQTAVRNWAIKFGFVKTPKYIELNQTYGKEIILKYQKEGILIKDIAQQYNVDSSIIARLLKYNNIELKTRKEIKKELDNRNLCRIFSVNHDYFKIWNHNMAYILGFIAADGNILHRKYQGKLRSRLTINLNAVDIELLEKIKKELQYEGNIYKFKSKLKYKKFDSCSLKIDSKDLVSDLINLGITEKKSYTIKIPDNIPEKYEIDFVRGYFDGDGSVNGYYPTNSNEVRTKTLQIRVRIASGSKEILEQINTIFVKRGLNSKNISKQRDVYEICYSTFESIKIYNLFYQNPNALFLQRKKQKFQDLINERNKK